MLLNAAVTVTGVKVSSLQNILKERLAVHLEICTYLYIMTEES